MPLLKASLVGLLILLSLSGCTPRLSPSALKVYSSTKPLKKMAPYLASFEAQGKIGFQKSSDRGTAFLDWKQQNQHYQIRLVGPLGLGSVKIKGHPQGILIQDGKGLLQQAKHPEALLQKTLGFSLPVAGLRYWLQGRPSPHSPHTLWVDGKGVLSRIEQQGWTITYQAYQTVNTFDLPAKIYLENQDIKLKFIFTEWRLE